MNIKSLLLGSAAAMVAVSTVHAADAVVIPEPEAVEYVRVCDAAGAGYFYIPGGETCLKISGYVQYEIYTGVGSPALEDDWNKAYEARIQFDAWRDTSYGALATVIRLTAGGSADPSATRSLNVDRAYFDLAGLRIGVDASAWDYGFGGPADYNNNGGSNGGTIRYTANFGAGSFTLSLEEDSNSADYMPSVVGVIGLDLGSIDATIGAVYEDDVNEWGAKATVAYNADYSAGAFSAGAGLQYSSAGSSTYNTTYEWVLGADIGYKATDALTLGLGMQYGMDEFADGNDDDFTVGALVSYDITETLNANLRVRYYEDFNAVAVGDQDAWDARLRFRSTF